MRCPCTSTHCHGGLPCDGDAETGKLCECCALCESLAGLCSLPIAPPAPPVKYVIVPSEQAEGAIDKAAGELIG